MSNRRTNSAIVENIFHLRSIETEYDRRSIVLPSIHEAIPEFRSHVPSKRRRPSRSEKEVLQNSPRVPITRPFSPTPSASLSHVSSGQLVSPEKKRRLNTSTPRRTVTSPRCSEPLIPLPSGYAPTIRSSLPTQFGTVEAIRTNENAQQIHRIPNPILQTASSDTSSNPFTFRHPSVSDSHERPIRQTSINRDYAGRDSEQRQIHRTPFIERAFNHDDYILDRSVATGYGKPIYSGSMDSLAMVPRHQPSSVIDQHKMHDTMRGEHLAYTQMPSQGRSYSKSPHEEPSNDGYDQSRFGKRRRGNLPKPITDLLRKWLHAHVNHPYPTEDQKQDLVSKTGLTMNQISNWFINARRRRLPVMTASDTMQSSSRMTHNNL